MCVCVCMCMGLTEGCVCVCVCVCVCIGQFLPFAAYLLLFGVAKENLQKYFEALHF